jgi:2,4-dienoyl-CoA reductase
MALHYSKLGGEVTIIGRSTQKLRTTADEIDFETQNRPRYESVDVRENPSILRLVNQMVTQDQFPDIVINNAAGNFICRSEDLSYNGWNSILDIVLKGTLNMTLEFGKKMIELEKPGVFLNISTTYAETGSGYVMPSSVAKAGCNNMTRSLAAEWGKYGIRLNSVAPGPIHTEGAFSRLDPGNKFSDIAKDNLPLGRFGEKEEIANLVTYLTTEENGWMTGQVFNLDGGEVVGNSGEFNLLRNVSDTEWKMYRKMSQMKKIFS